MKHDRDDVIRWSVFEEQQLFGVQIWVIGIFGGPAIFYSAQDLNDSKEPLVIAPCEHKSNIIVETFHWREWKARGASHTPHHQSSPL